MKKIWSNYKQTIILLASIIIGAIVGLMWGKKASVLSPFGDLFINIKIGQPERSIYLVILGMKSQ